jgi:hypothetical protein
MRNFHNRTKDRPVADASPRCKYLRLLEYLLKNDNSKFVYFPRSSKSMSEKLFSESLLVSEGEEGKCSRI